MIAPFDMLASIFSILTTHIH